MRFSDAGKSLLMRLEGVKLYPYDDRNGKQLTTWNKYATIGVGYLIPEKLFYLYKDGITRQKAFIMMEDVIPEYEQIIKDHVTKPLTQTEWDALVIFVYNLGETKFVGSSVQKMLCGEIGRYPTLEKAWKAWNKDNGVVKLGVVNRRNTEWNLFSKGDYNA